jgi:hypothetical protein
MLFIARIGAFLPSLFGFKPSIQTSRVLGIGVLVVAAVLLFILGKTLYDRSVVNDYKDQVEVRAGKAREQAADQRVEDAAKNAKNEEDLHDAVNNAPKGGDLSPAARALACERLRKLGRVPAACRPQGSDGAQASPR